jgi:hypothetical protein
MVLIRDWRPTQNYSYPGSTPRRLLVIHTTEGFTGPNGMYDLAHYFAGDVGASSSVGIDNYHPGRIVEMVLPTNLAWTQCGYNSNTYTSVEQCAYASWSRDTWLGEKEQLLRNTAAWLAEESARSGIPLTELSASEAQGNGYGVTYHSRLGSVGCGHSDPGDGYPLDKVLQWAREDNPVIPSVPIPGDDEMAVYGFGNVTESEPRWLCTFMRGGPDRFTVFGDASAENPIVIKHAVHYGGRWAQHNTVTIPTANPWTLVFSAEDVDGVSVQLIQGSQAAISVYSV